MRCGCRKIAIEEIFNTFSVKCFEIFFSIVCAIHVLIIYSLHLGCIS